MEPRLDVLSNDTAMKAVKYLVSAGRAAAGSLPPATQELVKIRASQINGCGFCLDMHTKDAAHAGETPVRLFDLRVPSALLSAMPYILTVIILAGFVGRAIPPRAGGEPYVKER